MNMSRVMPLGFAVAPQAGHVLMNRQVLQSVDLPERAVLMTQRGPQFARKLVIGDQLIVLGNPVYAAIRHIEHLHHAPCNVAILARDCLALGMPSRTLMLAEDTAVMIRSRIAARMYGQDDLLLPAGWLAQLGVPVDDPGEVGPIVRLWLDRPVIICANGTLLGLGGHLHPVASAFEADARRFARLLARHRKNARAFFEGVLPSRFSLGFRPASRPAPAADAPPPPDGHSPV